MLVEGSPVAGTYDMSYVCPEELVVAQQPSAKGDVWAAGCVYAELLEKKGPLFQGSTHKEVLAKICARVGRPSETLLRDMIYGDTPMHQFVLAQDPVPGLPTGDSTSPYFRAAFSIADADADALQCIAATVRFDPRARMTAENALASLKLFQARKHDPCLHKPSDEPRLACSAYHESMASRDAPAAAGAGAGAAGRGSEAGAAGRPRGHARRARPLHGRARGRAPHRCAAEHITADGGHPRASARRPPRDRRAGSFTTAADYIGPAGPGRAAGHGHDDGPAVRAAAGAAPAGGLRALGSVPFPLLRA